MNRQEAQVQAAKALSKILAEHGIGHAFIGGFAVNLLGNDRETADIDVEIDAGDYVDMRARVTKILVENDTRFSYEHLKLVFTPADHPEWPVPVETLPIGMLGLPCHLDFIRPGDGRHLSSFP